VEDSIGVAEAKQRFSELLDRVGEGEGEGEHIVVARRARPAVVLVPPGHDAGRASTGAPLGFAAIAGALADLPEIDDIVADVDSARRGARNRPAPDLG
jgi:prevent-host-death family protein